MTEAYFCPNQQIKFKVEILYILLIFYAKIGRQNRRSEATI